MGKVERATPLKWSLSWLSLRILPQPLILAVVAEVAMQRKKPRRKPPAPTLLVRMVSSQLGLAFLTLRHPPKIHLMKPLLP